MGKGSIIVLEGLDGCGKSTQLELAAQSLIKRGVDCRRISFPEYGSDSGRIISGYLEGDIPCDGEIGAYAASSFYAIDRYISFVKDWKRDYERGAVILSGRYTSSNIIYQMTKAENREMFMNWLTDYEYNKLGLPKSDMVIFLDMPPEVSHKLLSKRYEGDESKKDIHERDRAFLDECRKSALYAAKLLGWRIISCAKDGSAREIAEIHEEIMRTIDNA
ncbi:MAG: thymidylate kinase [Oscillospiraceae bacterium]|nr:thymidylate kinase [Oscillospiraceae bacterium]